MKKTIALVGGGTGGHIFPLLWLYNYLKEEKEYNFVWVWEEDSLEEEIALKNKIPFLWVAAGKIRRYFDIKNFYEPLKNFTGVFQSMLHIKKYKIDIIFSKWGYVSIPLCIAGKLMGKKILVHESDIKIGLSNTIVSKFANHVFYTFPNHSINGKKHILSWQILNPELIDYINDAEVEENERLNVLVSAGSQGSTTIFTYLLNILPELPYIDFHIILWEKNLHFREDFKKFPQVKVHDFITQKRLGKIYKDIDLAIARWGATTLWELYFFGIHTIIVPLKNSAWEHQEKNAYFFKQNFMSDIVSEWEDADIEILKLLEKYKDLRKVGLNLDDFFQALKKIKEYL